MFPVGIHSAGGAYVDLIYALGLIYIVNFIIQGNRVLTLAMGLFI